MRGSIIHPKYASRKERGSRPAKEANMNFQKGNLTAPAAMAMRSKMSPGTRAKRKMAKLP